MVPDGTDMSLTTESDTINWIKDGLITKAYMRHLAQCVNLLNLELLRGTQ